MRAPLALNFFTPMRCVARGSGHGAKAPSSLWIFASTATLALGLTSCDNASSTSSATGAGGAGAASSVTTGGEATSSAGTGGSATSGAGTGGSATGGSAASGSAASGSAASGSGTGGGGDGGALPMASPGSVINGLQWADAAGAPIQAHGGGILKVGSYYYWFGENRYPNGTFYAVSCYRSTDLVHWELRKNVLTAGSAAELKPANIERPKVVYNAATATYVMWMHWENGANYGEARAAVASSSTVDGDYTYQGSFRPLAGTGVMDHGKAGYMSRDSTLYVDTDGQGYFLSASNENNDLNLYLLTSDYLKIDKLVSVLFPGGHREAPALFKRNGVYFLVTSDATGWSPNQAKYATSSSIGGGWKGWTNVGDSTTFHSQSTFVLPIDGSAATTYLYLGDRWAGAWSAPVNDSTYVWQPIAFPSATSMSMSWSNTLTIDAAAGNVTGANNRFKLVNKASGKVMGVSNASKEDGGTVVQGADSGVDDQKWTLNYDGAGYFYVTNVNSGRVLDVPSNSTADGTALLQWTSNAGDNQKWRVIDSGGGYFQIRNKNSGKLAEVAQSSTADGAAIDQAGGSGDNQLWRIVSAD